MPAKYLKLSYGPQTLTIPSIVGAPLRRGGVIRLENEDHIEALLGKDSSFVHAYDDGTTRHYFEDVTEQYAHREKAIAPSADVIDDGGDNGGDSDNGGSDNPEAGKAPRQRQRAAK